MSEIDQYAVFGSPIKHSKSPRIHQLFAEQTQQVMQYTAQLVPADKFDLELKDFFAKGGRGLNCTVPLKELAWEAAEIRTERAELAKAVNTLLVQEDGRILGDNTDGIGLVTDLQDNHGIELKQKWVLILGAGGASRGIILPILEESPASITIANRTVEKALTLADEFSHKGAISGSSYADLAGQNFDLILNATSASLSDELPPLVSGILAEQGSCYDLAYANKPTAFVRWAREQQASKSLDGLGMLVEQAAEAFYLWRNVRPDTTPVIQMLEAERNNRQRVSV
ncbi:shikimate dehydrogenase [Bathymodiolus platifrons methanotrophic gill symbiont]|uniref:shikimate dehydrogenase n=1 Tax=Bathymodiolus platifrons methanotrophic gill symbiont TaxID=113268 RepID=UPI000B41DC31|nr:shikimate dehydrogenase [Bathymodiolus platifrons methanotrophic gill symbiont]TXK97460.1 shikimate dehydrogenase [Methylococcaceae bacterium CS4]GAW85127.1 shikimate dehydrogenase [Bathymodiolus platifrons methanotrophic gill symbiont]GFO75862.1 shikimate dehydrogenase [Bathymodiolus platifrons methanotrophic gill symbiont]